MTIEQRNEHGFKEGDVVFIGTADGIAPALIHSVDGNRVFVDYGGIVSLLHANERAIHVPLELEDTLRRELSVESHVAMLDLERATEGIRMALEQYAHARSGGFLGMIRDSLRSGSSKDKYVK